MSVVVVTVVVVFMMMVVFVCHNYCCFSVCKNTNISGNERLTNVGETIVSLLCVAMMHVVVY